MNNQTFYTQKYMEYGDNVKSLGWGSINSQNIRFNQLLYLDISDNDTILDVGCGFGDLKNYLDQKQFVVNYFGIDICNEFIEKCKQKYPDMSSKFTCIDLFDIEGTYDWVFCSGIFALERIDWCDHVNRCLTKLYTFVNKGLVVNFLYKFDPYINNRYALMHYTSLSEIEQILKNIDFKFILKYNYHTYDITLILEKNDLFNTPT